MNELTGAADKALSQLVILYNSCPVTGLMCLLSVGFSSGRIYQNVTTAWFLWLDAAI